MLCYMEMNSMNILQNISKGISYKNAFLFNAFNILHTNEWYEWIMAQKWPLMKHIAKKNESLHADIWTLTDHAEINTRLPLR